MDKFIFILSLYDTVDTKPVIEEKKETTGYDSERCNSCCFAFKGDPSNHLNSALILSGKTREACYLLRIMFEMSFVYSRKIY